MGPTAVLVLVVGVLVVLVIAGVALALDARRRGPVGRPVPPPYPADTVQTEPIDTARAQQDPPTVATRSDRPGESGR